VTFGEGIANALSSLGDDRRPDGASIQDEHHDDRSANQRPPEVAARGEGYPREIARFYNTDLKSVQNQLAKLEAGGVLVSRQVGRTRPYVFNPRYPFLNELKSLLEKALSFYPAKQQEELVMNRRRPRARGKELRSASGT
jgi:hypothetical protein